MDVEELARIYFLYKSSVRDKNLRGAPQSIYLDQITKYLRKYEDDKETDLSIDGLTDV